MVGMQLYLNSIFTVSKFILYKQYVLHTNVTNEFRLQEHFNVESMKMLGKSKKKKQL